MSVDFNAMATAIAARFTAANVTQPSGEADIRGATSVLPNQIPATPFVLVFPPEPGGIDFTYRASARSGVAVFPVRFYLVATDKGRNATLVLKWLGALYDQLTGQVQLGLSSYTSYAVIRNMGAARLTYGGAEYEGVAMDAEVHFSEGTAPVA